MIEVHFNVAKIEDAPAPAGRSRIHLHLFRTDWYQVGIDGRVGAIERELVRAFPAPEYKVQRVSRDVAMTVSEVLA